MFGDLVPVPVVGFFLLQARGVGQQNLHQLGGAARTINRPPKSMMHQARQVTGVIDMSMRDDDGINRGGVEWRFVPIAQTQLLQTLKQSAIDEYTAPVRFDQVLGSSDGSGRTPK